MRLAALLLEHPLGATPATYALSALMCLNAARLPARVDVSGKLTSLFDQDRSLWDRDLVTEGIRLLELAASGSELTEYHVELRSRRSTRGLRGPRTRTGQRSFHRTIR
jgi:RNA polymerase sigma-70 factor (ECF subfamily)